MIRKAPIIIMGSALLLAFISFVPRMRADEGDEATELTFNQPVQLPRNIVLPAGTYWFVMPDDAGGSQIMQVFNSNRTQLLDTVETNTTERSNLSDDVQLTFSKLSPNRPILLVSWFYPDRKDGHRLVYSHQQENQLSDAGRTTVFGRTAPQVG